MFQLERNIVDIFLKIAIEYIQYSSSFPKKYCKILTETTKREF